MKKNVKKGRGINLCLGNKVFYSIMFILILVVLIGVVFALEQWEIHGHSSDEVEGEGPPLVMLHGLTASLEG